MLEHVGMRVLIFSQHFPPETMATGRRARDLAESLTSRGHEVTVITGRPNHPSSLDLPFCQHAAQDEYTAQGYRILRVPVFRSLDSGTLKRFLTYSTFMLSAAWCGIWQRKPDVVLAVSPLPTGLAALPAHAWHRAPLVFDLQDIWPDSALAVGLLHGSCLMGLLRCLEQFFYRRCAKVVVITEGFERYLLNLGLPRNRVAVVCNGVQWQSFVGVKPREELRKSVGLAGKFVVGYVGNIGLAQGLETLLGAAEQLRDEPVAFLLVGEGTDKRRLLDLARARALANVRFLAGVPGDQVFPILATCDALLVILRKDPLFEITIPSKLYEYMAAGKPILCSVGGEAAELVSELGCGLPVAPSDSAALAESVRRLQANPQWGRLLGEAGADCVREVFSRDSLMDAYAQLVENEAMGRAHAATDCSAPFAEDIACGEP
ncbi:MAG: glycosyltransferase family 4 protein [Terriglobia bacterium]